MTSTLEIIKKFLPAEVYPQLKLKNFSPGEIIGHSNTINIFIVLEGEVSATAFYENKEYFFPNNLKPGDMGGLSNLLLWKKTWWEYVALTEVEAVFIPQEVLDNYLLCNLSSYKFLVELAAYQSEKVIKALYLQVQGGARSAFAYLIVECSVNNEYSYIKYESIASSLNITRARLYKLEKEFSQKGLIRRGHKKIVVLNREGLMNYYCDFLFIK